MVFRATRATAIHTEPTGRENKAIVPRSKVKTGQDVADSRSLVVESDPSCCLTQFASVCQSRHMSVRLLIRALGVAWMFIGASKVTVHDSVAKFLECCSLERLCKIVRQHVVARTILDVYLILFDAVRNKKISYVQVSCSSRT